MKRVKMYNVLKDLKRIELWFRLWIDTKDIQLYNQCYEFKDEIYFEINTLAKIEFPEKDFSFVTIRHQWKKFCIDPFFYSNVDKDLTNLIELTYIFYKNEIDDYFFSKIQAFLKINNLSPGKKDKYEIKNEKYIEKKIKWISNQLSLHRMSVRWACAIYALCLIINKRPFTSLNDSIALLIFKKILAGSDENDSDKILSFNCPLIKTIYGTRLENKKLSDLSIILYKIVLDVHNKNRERQLKKLDDYLKGKFDPKKAYYHSNEKLKKTNELQKGYEEGLQIWKSTNFKKTIDKLITKDNAKKIFDLYTELGYKNELEENQGSAQDFDYIFNMTVASFQGNLHNFFQRIWLANHIMDEERNIELLDKLKKFLSKKHDDFILLLVSIAESASFYLYIYKSLLNKSRVDKADAKNPKKMKSLAKNI